jgi:hypothetical protein
LTPAPNPLETYDQDRLYVLINAAVGLGRAAECARYFQEADNQAADNTEAGALKRAAFSQICPESMVKIAAYLEHNGVSGVTPAHLQGPAFWDQMQAKYEAIQQCQAGLGGDMFNPPPDPANPKPKQADFPNYEAFNAARVEYGRRRKEQAEEWGRAKAACDPYQAAQGENPDAGLADFGISLPEGMKVDMMGRIN